MAVSSNRSPSLLSSRPNPPHPRNSESNSTIRRSFSGNPFHRPSVLTNPRSFNPVTPANSPAGFGRRNSEGKEGIGQLQSCDEKENEKDQILKPVKVRSPANGSKNFMSPTISAASKFTPSPRKKPLVERNEPVRTSISLSDGKATFFSAIFSEYTEDLTSKSELLGEQKKAEGSLESTVTHLDQNEATLDCPPVSKAIKRVTFAELPSNSEKATGGLPSDNVTIDSDSLNVESNPQNKTSCFSVSHHVIAPLDADPSVPPYDPKTNYLSPRPQFLHYKPNPRIEVLLHYKEKGLDSEVKRLEDSFILETSSDTFSDTDDAEESNSDDSNKDFEDSSAGIEEPEVKEEEEEGLSDKLDISTPISHENTEEIVGRNGSFFTSLKFASLLLVFLIGFISISVTNYPVMNSPVPKSFSFSELHLPSGIADTSKANFHTFTTGRVKQLSFDSMYHLSLLIKNISGHDNLSPLQFINLTDIQKDVLVEGHIHASGSPLPIDPIDNEVCEKVIGGKGSEKFSDFYVQEHLEVQENDESLPFEEETHVGAVSDDTRETEIDGEVNLGTQELASTTASVPEMKEPGRLETLWGQEEMKEPEPESRVGAVSDDTSKKEPHGEIELGTQELKYIPSPVLQMKEPLSLETVWGQEDEVPNDHTEVKFDINVEDCIDPVTKVLEVESEEKALENEVQPELLETTKVECAIDLGSGAKIETSVVDINVESNSDIIPFEMVKSSPIDASENTLSAHFITGVTSIVLLALISVAAYVYLNRRGTISKSNPAVHTDQLLRKKKIIPALSVLEQIHQQRPSSQNWSTEVDVMGESCPSEMSSFQTRSSHSRLRNANEAQSQERKPRKHSKRESLASSSEYSTGSPSYGSFTTYEKIPSKNASGDDEIMTPVRRSSRIRNQFT